MLDGEVALVRGNEFKTGFIFGSQPWRPGRTINERERNSVIPLMYDGQIGLMDINGEVVLPFIFEGFAFIDDRLAFARYNGMFGMLSVIVN